VVLEVERGAVGVAGRTLLSDFELWLERGEHISLVGPNGTGKTTLIEALAGRSELGAGKLRRGHNAKIGYLSQHAEELGNEGTVLEATQRATGLTPNKARALLGRFLFSGEEAEKPLVGLSGGERRRVSLAVLYASGANVLILDEPTNHLDVESREALEDALRSFDGSVLLVSHDRALLDAVGTRTVAVEGQTLRSYEGGWTEYLRQRRPKETQTQTQKAESRKPKAAPSGPSKNQVRRIERIEADIAAAEAALARLEDELADPSSWSSPSATERNAQRHAEARAAVEALYAQLETAGA
jgi:ATP-binding cassette subfamily F protein 3